MLRQTDIAPILRGLATYAPGLSRFSLTETGGSNSARYCYAVWLRHLVWAQQAGLSPHPHTVAELGPGDSIGVGLAALLSGAERYYAFDRLPYARDPRRNLDILEELIPLFQTRQPIPDAVEFPKLKPTPPDYAFPAACLPAAQLDLSLAPARLERLRQLVSNPDQPSTDGLELSYYAPWSSADGLMAGEVDVIVSQAALEHVDALEETYAAFALWLRPGGWMSHQIDFKSHGTAAEWNGHWRYPDWAWRLVRGRRPWLINRAPYSTHLALLERFGFRLVYAQPASLPNSLRQAQLARRFRTLSESDLTTAGVFIVAQKEGA